MARTKQEEDLKMAALRKAIEEGDSSGIATGDVFARIRRKLRHNSAKNAKQ
jgi:hypothetical protein